jgi:hypothetical protein
MLRALVGYVHNNVRTQMGCEVTVEQRCKCCRRLLCKILERDCKFKIEIRCAKCGKDNLIFSKEQQSA